MAVAQLESVISSALATLDSWNNSLADLMAIAGPDHSKFELSAVIPGLDPRTTIEDLGQKLTGTIILVQELSQIETTILIPDAMISDLMARAGAMRATTEKLAAQLSAFESNAKVVSLNPEAIVAANDKGQQINAGPILVELYPLVQAVLLSAYQVRGVSSISGKGGLALELTQMQAARTAQRKAIGDFNRLSRILEGRRKELEELVTSSTAAVERINAAEKQASEDIGKVTTSKQKAEELIASATASEETASKVKEAVEAYAKSFAAFQQELENRNNAFEKGKSDLQAFFKNSEERLTALLQSQKASHAEISAAIQTDQEEIERLLARSRAVLGEATVSGLSDSFAKEMTQASGQLWWMQVLFFVSVGLLLCGAGIVLDAFPWLSGVIHITRIEPPSNGEPLAVGVYLLANFLRTLTFLLAPLVLLIYAARRYTELFRMKAHYTYKYTVAASLPGFKLEAPTYAEAITASAFEELLFNPGDTVGKPEDDASEKGNTFIQSLIEPLVKRAMDKMGEVPK